ncbi:methyl-accepting chemotaxis protein [Marinomonas gallaica]|uniref:methyl-accepting chemotaxis protein n=1 Tax=Marinomonas gallaica TaxID=1806667 RepID=UPI003CE4E24D
MKIKQKLILNTAVVVLAMVLLATSFLVAENSLKDLIVGKELAQKQESNMLLLRRHEKDFLARDDVKYVERFNETLQRTMSQQQELDRMFVDLDINSTDFTELDNLFRQYGDNFKELVTAKQTMGLTPEDGLNGNLRNAVHKIETSLNELDKAEMLVTMLQLRRHEKDFMLRLDMKYAERFASKISILNNQIQNAQIDEQTKNTLMKLSGTYQKSFTNYVEQQQRIGLGSDQGILGKMRNTIHQTESKLQLMGQSMTNQTDLLFSNIQVALSAIIVLVTLAVIVIAWRISCSINYPLALIRNAMLKVDETRDLNLRVSYDAKDEIGDVARSMNQMLAGFQTVVGSVNDTVISMNQQTKMLSETAERTATDAERQRDETDMVAASVSEMVGTIEDISRNMELVAEKTNSTQKGVSDGQARVSNAVSLVHDLSSRLDSSMETAEALAQESQSIGTVLNVIQGIAEQTNLLALNAAIEAARAGEQGRGFAVVADEVRALASRTHDATVEISDIISSLQNRTQGIVTIMKECGADGLRSSEEASVIGDVLVRITDEINEIADMAHSVASAIGQQSIAANEINQNVTVIREISMDTSEAVRLNSKSSVEISGQAHHLEDVISRFKI